MKKSDLTDFPEYYQKYIDWVEEGDLLAALEDSLRTISTFFLYVPEEKLDYRYQAEKWSIKEVLAHLTDSERIMGYRALRFARNDKTELSGYDQDNYVKNSKAAGRNIAYLVNDYSSARKANLELFKSFDDEMLLRRGIANKWELSVLLIGFVIVGHGFHHVEIIKQRYL